MTAAFRPSSGVAAGCPAGDTPCSETTHLEVDA